MKELKKLLIGLAETFGTTLSEQRMAIYVEILKNQPLMEVQRAINEILTDSRYKFFPLPAVILEHIAPPLNTDHDAIESANRIVQAIANFGYYQAEGAKRFIGELGWLVVEREGGWEGLCESLTTDQIPTRKAQWRELAKALIGRSQRGTLGTPPELPPSGSGGVVRSLADRLSIGKPR